MRKIHYLILLVLAVITLPASSLQAKSKKNKPNQEQFLTTGAQDRATWVQLLWKISYPVIHNLAEGTLRQNMPDRKSVV